MPEERVVIFIDGSNLYHCLMEEVGRANVDFSHLGQVLCEGRRLIRTYYYNAVVRRVEAVKAIGKHVEVAFVTRGRSLELQHTADRFVLLDAEKLSRCWTGSGRSPGERQR